MTILNSLVQSRYLHLKTKGFKISTNWLLYLKNLIGQVIDNQIIILFNSV